MESRLIKSEQEIEVVINDAAQCRVHKVGENGVERIECYGEPGEYCYIPFLEIWVNGKVKERLCALTLRIVYK